MARSRSAKGQPYRSSNQVTVRTACRRQPHLAARTATRSSPHPPSASSPAGRNCGTPEPLRSLTSTRITPSAAFTVTVTVPPGRPDRLCRTLLPKSSLTSKTAVSPHGCPVPSTPLTNARATRARPASPASVTLSRTAPVTSAPGPFPAVRPGKSRGRRPAHGDGHPTRRHTSSRNALPAWGRLEAVRLALAPIPEAAGFSSLPSLVICRAAGQGWPTRTRSLPVFLPSKSISSAAGAAVSPSTTCSRLRSSPLRSRGRRSASISSKRSR
jgi:hypothetical protein